MFAIAFRSRAKHEIDQSGIPLEHENNVVVDMLESKMRAYQCDAL